MTEDNVAKFRDIQVGKTYRFKDPVRVRMGGRPRTVVSYDPTMPYGGLVVCQYTGKSGKLTSDKCCGDWFLANMTLDR
jgi:hypothetical protein